MKLLNLYSAQADSLPFAKQRELGTPRTPVEMSFNTRHGARCVSASTKFLRANISLAAISTTIVNRASAGSRMKSRRRSFGSSLVGLSLLTCAVMREALYLALAKACETIFIGAASGSAPSTINSQRVEPVSSVITWIKPSLADRKRGG